MMATGIRVLARRSALVLGLLCTSLAGPGLAQDWGPVLDRTDPSVGRVISEYADGYSSGSGFVLRDGAARDHFFFMTNHHVVDPPPQSVEVYFLIDDEPKRYQARIVDANRYYDLALLRITPAEGGLHDAPGLTIATREFSRGLPVAAIGFPGAADYQGVSSGTDVFVSSANIGRVSRLPAMAWAPDGPPFEVVQHDAVINSGNSGGPLIDFCGNLVGVNTAGPPTQANAQGIFWSTSGNSVKLYLDELGHRFEANSAVCPTEGGGGGQPGITTDGPDLVQGGTSGGLADYRPLLMGGAVAALAAAGAAVFLLQKGAAPQGANGGAGAAPGAPPPPASGGAPLLTLDIELESGERLKRPITAEALKRGVTIGRSSSCDVSVPDERVSREHARLTLDGRRLCISDLGSTGGTRLDGAALSANTPAQINTKSAIRIGRSSISVRKG